MRRSALTAALPRSAIASRLHAVHPYVAGGFVATGVVVIVEWAIGSEPLKTFVPSITSMKVNTAIGLMVLGVALFGLNRHAAAGLVPLGPAVVAGLALGTLAEYAFGVDLRIDNAILRDPAAIEYPGRSAPATNAAFLGLAGSILLLYARAEDRAAALAAGVGAHLTKPVDPVKLVATIVSLAARPAAFVPFPGVPGGEQDVIATSRA